MTTKKGSAKKKKVMIDPKLAISPATVTHIEQSSVDRAKVFNKGAMIVLNFGTPGFDRKVASEDFDATDKTVDKTMLNASKKLIECDEFKAIGTINGKIKGYLQRHSIPTALGPFESLYMVPRKYFMPIMEYLREMKDGERMKAIEAFLAVYDKAKDEAKKKLGPLYEESDYPSKDELRAGFYMNIIPMDFTTPGLIKTINEQMFEECRIGLDARFQEAAENMRLLQRETMRKLVTHLTERLTGTGTDGKPKVFRESAVTHVTEFTTAFKDLDVTDDIQLTALVEQTNKLLAGVDIEALRKPDEYRVQMGKDLAKVTTALDALMVTKVSRKIRLRGEG